MRRSKPWWPKRSVLTLGVSRIIAYFYGQSMDILEKIILHKRQEVAHAKAQVSTAHLEASAYFSRSCWSLKATLTLPYATGIIAEFKRKSPSKGIINDQVTVSDVTTGYVQAGAAGLSVLTDASFFGGSPQDLHQAREANPHIPILRKDFVIDEYQLLEAKSWGADVVLLIAANLLPEEVYRLGQFARQLGLEVLLEVHDTDELRRSLCEHVSIVGVNNRNLKNFAEQNVNASLELAELIPNEFLKISESCISHPETILQLREVGYDGFLIGENFMKTPQPGQAMQAFVAQLTPAKV
jgi:indole-3-glycerol phosphate synthase